MQKIDRSESTLDLTDWQNKKFSTRDGRAVRILCVDAPGDYPIVGLVAGSIDVQTWKIDGHLFGEKDRPIDLINAKTKREGWVNVHRGSGGGRYLSGVIYDSEESAKKNGPGIGLAYQAKITWEES